MSAFCGLHNACLFTLSDIAAVLPQINAFHYNNVASVPFCLLRFSRLRYHVTLSLSPSGDWFGPATGSNAPDYSAPFFPFRYRERKKLTFSASIAFRLACACLAPLKTCIGIPFVLARNTLVSFSPQKRLLYVFACKGKAKNNTKTLIFDFKTIIFDIS